MDNSLNYNQYLSCTKNGGYIYSKEVHTLTREVEIKRVREFPFRFFIHDKEAKEGITDVKGNVLKTIKAKSLKEFKEKVSMFQTYGHALFGTEGLAYQYIFDGFDHAKHNNKLVRIGYFDIETARDAVTGYSKATQATNPITTISMVINGKNYYWARKDLSSAFIEKHKLEFFWFEHENHMLEHFINFFRENVDVISGWNIETYDIPYVVTRAMRLDLDPEKLSPFGKLRKKSFLGKFGGEEVSYKIFGIETLDYLNLYKKFTYKTPDNYKLDTIAENELGDKKVDYSEYGSLDALYEQNFELFSDYNIQDSRIVHRLEDKLKLIDLAITLAYKTGVNFEDTLGTVKMWTYFLYQEMMNKNIAPPMFQGDMPSKPIVGGFVKETLTGKYKWSMSFDLASLYPHNQMGCNISFDKLLDYSELPPEVAQLKDEILAETPSVVDCIERVVAKDIDLSCLKKYNIGMTPNIQFYKNDGLGIIPAILKEVYNERKAVKKEMLVRKQEKQDTGNKKLDAEIARLNAIQMALKILMNSEYGALGNEHFLFYDTRNAEAITSAGQVAIKFISVKLNQFMNGILKTNDVDYIIATDTDSVYLNFGPVVDKFFPGKTDAETTDMLDKISKEKIQPFIDKSYHELTEYMNGFAMEWFMKREAIASSAVFVLKKRYFMHITDDEGVRMKKPKLKITGLEAIRSSTPDICRKALKSVMGTILAGDEKQVQDEVATFKEEFFEAPVIDICMPRGVKDIEKWIAPTTKGFKSGTPIGVRGAIEFNKNIAKKDPSYDLIKSGDKIKFTYLNLPNDFQSNVIGVPNEIPEILGLTDAIVDKELQFEKTYLGPLNGLLDIVGWHSKETNTLLSFFG